MPHVILRQKYRRCISAKGRIGYSRSMTCYSFIEASLIGNEVGEIELAFEDWGSGILGHMTSLFHNRIVRQEKVGSKSKSRGLAWVRSRVGDWESGSCSQEKH